MERLLNKKYEILERIAETDKVFVFKARHIKTNSLLAIKILKKKLTQDIKQVEIFNCEVETISKLSHSTVVSVYDVDYFKPYYYIAMEYFKGIPLDIALTKGFFPSFEQAGRMIVQLGKFLNYAASNGVKNRYIKLSNILIGTGGKVKVLNFSTPRSMTDENLSGIRSTSSSSSDIYFLGTTFFKMLTGKDLVLSFQGGNKGSSFELEALEIEEGVGRLTLEKSVAVKLAKIILLSVTKEIHKRYVSVEEMIDNLEKLLAQFQLGNPKKSAKIQTVNKDLQARKILFSRRKKASPDEIQKNIKNQKVKSPVPQELELKSNETHEEHENRDQEGISSTLIWDGEGKLQGESSFDEVNPTYWIIFALLLLAALSYMVEI